MGQIYEIKSVYSEAVAVAKVGLYVGILNKFDKDRTWIPGITYLPPPILRLDGSSVAFVSRPNPGVISYCVVNTTELAGLALAATTAGLLLDLASIELAAAYAY